MAGFITYDSTSKTYTISPGALTTDINATIKNAPNGSTIFFSAGNHILTEQVSIWRDNITIKGAGSGLTTLTVDQHGTSVAEGMRISGSKDSSWNGTLAANVLRGDHVVTLTSTAGLRAGDILHIQQSNDADFLSSGLYNNVKNTPEMAANPLRESLVEIDRIDGNVVYLKHDVAYDMQGGRATISRYGYLENVHVSDFTMTYNLPDANDALFENTQTAFDNKAALSVERTYNIDIQNINFTNVASHSLEVRRSLEAHVDSIKTDGTLNKGSDGNGYSLHIAETFYSTFTNLQLMNGRHAVVFSSWSAEAYNNVQVALTNRDINYHGSPDHSNVVVIDKMVYAGGTDYTGAERSWYAVGPGSDMHPASTIADNITVFKYLEAGAKDDTVYGWNGGSYLNTKGGNDVVIGGDGIDTIIGGTGNDVLVGNASSDIFRFNVGDGNDIITDFHGGVGGDKIILKDMLQFAAPGSVLLTQVGADALLQLAGNNSILFQNFNVSNFTLNNISLENTITALVASTVPGTDTFMGGVLDDTITMTKAGWNKEDWIDLGAGTYDRIIVKGEGFAFNTAGLAKLSGVELIDLRSVTSGTMTLKLTDAVVGAVDGGRLKVAVGPYNIASIDTYGVTAEHEVHIYGTGTVTLASNGTQSVTLESKNGVLNVLGGTGSDILKIKGSAMGVALNAGAGNDTITVTTNTNHNINAGDGNDKIIFAFAPTVGMAINGGAGSDTISFLSNINAGSSVTSGWTGIENLSFGGVSNTLALHNMFSSSTLNIEGVGSMRNVTIDISALTATEKIQMDENVNLTLSGNASGAISILLTSAATGLFQGSSSAETITGSANADRLNGGGGNDTIYAGSGNDTVKGEDGADTLWGGSGTDTVWGGSGNDIIEGESGADYLYGEGGNDILHGGTSSDYLYGGDGNDILDGQESGDYLWGGTGNDRFIIGSNDARDVINDFNILLGEADVLDLASLFDANGLGDKTFSSAISGGFLKLTQSGTDVNIGFDVDGSAGSVGTLKTIVTITNELVGELNSTNVLL